MRICDEEDNKGMMAVMRSSFLAKTGTVGHDINDNNVVNATVLAMNTSLLMTRVKSILLFNFFDDFYARFSCVRNCL